MNVSYHLYLLFIAIDMITNRLTRALIGIADLIWLGVDCLVALLDDPDKQVSTDPVTLVIQARGIRPLRFERSFGDLLDVQKS